VTCWGTVGNAGDAEVDAAVGTARAVLVSKPWSDASPARPAAALGRLADTLSARKGVLADLATAEIGSPRSWSTFGQVLTAVGVLRAYASITPDYPFESTRPSLSGGAVDVRQLPVGVVSAIIPWNTPLFIAALKLGPALVAGCTVVLKPAPDAPLSIGVLTEAIEEAGLPDGVVNILTGGKRPQGPGWFVTPRRGLGHQRHGDRPRVGVRPRRCGDPPRRFGQ
jgi:betaine-aldehyde dehydrogenase